MTQLPPLAQTRFVVMMVCCSVSLVSRLLSLTLISLFHTASDQHLASYPTFLSRDFYRLQYDTKSRDRKGWDEAREAWDEANVGPVHGAGDITI